MKKTILAVAIPALFAASAQAANVYDADGVSADVYGRMQFQIADDGTDTNGVGSARMGFNAKSEIAPGIAGVAKGEWQIAAEDADDSKFKARHLYAGFDFDDAGTVVFGQTDTAFYKAVEATDIFNGNVGYEAFTLVEDGRQEGQIIYSGEFGGFYVGASYQFKEDNFSINAGSPNGIGSKLETALDLDSSYAATLGYTFADLGLSTYIGYHVEDFAGDAEKKNLALSAAYTLGDLYLGAAYVQSKLDNIGLVSSGDTIRLDKFTGYDFVAAYTIDAVKLYTGYAAQDGDFTVNGSGISADTADAFKLGVQYAFNSNMKAWAEYKVDGIDGADDYWEMSLQYNF